ncbi:MAG: Fic family protein [Chloroflexi bacterium]|nr:Fic family protein [Chloroflexota bacterium]
MNRLKQIAGTPYEYYENIETRLQDLHHRVLEMRRVGKLSPQALEQIYQFFKIKDIYHSNAIEGNALDIGETQLVVEMGMTITGKSLRDQAEAKNLSAALDYMHDLAGEREKPITIHDIRQIHALILKGIEDEHAGKFRDTEVRISGSEYVPPEAFRVPGEMSALGEYLQQISSLTSPSSGLPILCATAAHAWLAQIHPFIDGNGRTARILMNLILIRYGYPICIVSKEERKRYYDALKESQASNLTPLIELVYENVEESLEAWEEAAEEERENKAWLASIRERIEGPDLKQLHNDYVIWHNGMDLLKEYFKRTVDDLSAEMTFDTVRFRFKDFGTLDFEKYQRLRNERSAKKTWFFGLEFHRENRRARYMFFFGYADHQLRQRSPVVLFVAKDIDYTYNYVRLKEITQPNIPDIQQIGFDIKEQDFILAKISGVAQKSKAEDLARQFFDQVIKRDLST